MAFLDMEKAYDQVNRKKLIEVMHSAYFTIPISPFASFIRTPMQLWSA